MCNKSDIWQFTLITKFSEHLNIQNFLLFAKKSMKVWDFNRDNFGWKYGLPCFTSVNTACTPHPHKTQSAVDSAKNSILGNQPNYSATPIFNYSASKIRLQNHPCVQLTAIELVFDSNVKLWCAIYTNLNGTWDEKLFMKARNVITGCTKPNSYENCNNSCALVGKF